MESDLLSRYVVGDNWFAGQ